MWYYYKNISEGNVMDSQTDDYKETHILQYKNDDLIKTTFA